MEWRRRDCPLMYIRVSGSFGFTPQRSHKRTKNLVAVIERIQALGRVVGKIVLRVDESWRHPIEMIFMPSLRLLLVAAAACCTSAFVVPTKPKSSLVTSKALWRHFVPRNTDVWEDTHPSFDVVLKNGVLASCLALMLALPAVSLAVSGGGLDYANLDITGQNFSNGNYKGKDFTQVKWYGVPIDG